MNFLSKKHTFFFSAQKFPPADIFVPGPLKKASKYGVLKDAVLAHSIRFDPPKYRGGISGNFGGKSAKNLHFFCNFFTFFIKMHYFFMFFFRKIKKVFLCLCFSPKDSGKTGEKNVEKNRNFPEIFPPGHFRDFSGIFGGIFLFPSRKTV